VKRDGRTEKLYAHTIVCGGIKNLHGLVFTQKDLTIAKTTTVDINMENLVNLIL